MIAVKETMKSQESVVYIFLFYSDSYPGVSFNI